MTAWNFLNKDLPDANLPERAQFRATRCLPGEIAPYVLLPGDPARAGAALDALGLPGQRLITLRKDPSAFRTSAGGEGAPSLVCGPESDSPPARLRSSKTAIQLPQGPTG